MGNVNEDGETSPNWGGQIWLALMGLSLLAICGGVAHLLWSA